MKNFIISRHESYGQDNCLTGWGIKSCLQRSIELHNRYGEFGIIYASSVIRAHETALITSFITKGAVETTSLLTENAIECRGKARILDYILGIINDAEEKGYDNICCITHLPVLEAVFGIYGPTGITGVFSGNDWSEVRENVLARIYEKFMPQKEDTFEYFECKNRLYTDEQFEISKIALGIRKESLDRDSQWLFMEKNGWFLDIKNGKVIYVTFSVDDDLSDFEIEVGPIDVKIVSPYRVQISQKGITRTFEIQSGQEIFEDTEEYNNVFSI